MKHIQFFLFDFFWTGLERNCACCVPPCLGGMRGCALLSPKLNFSVRKSQEVKESYSQKNFPLALVSFTNFENASQNFSKFTHVFGAFDLIWISDNFVCKLANLFQSFLEVTSYFKNSPFMFYSARSYPLIYQLIRFLKVPIWIEN